MKALVIGADGFAGRWLLRHLVASDDQVIATVGPNFSSPLPCGLTPIPLDVRFDAEIRRIVRSVHPDAIYYLAGISSPSERDIVALAYPVAFDGAISTVLSAAEQTHRPRVLLVGSSHVYGDVEAGRAITETAPLRPTTVYGAFKAAAEIAALTLGEAKGVEVIVARPFNHIGPGQRSGFVAADLAHQVAAIKSSGGKTIHVGSLDVLRDFTDVRDVVRAYRLLAVRGRPGQSYNIASGQPVAIREIVRELLRLAGIAPEVVIDRDRSRREPLEVAGDASKIRRDVGWVPEIPLTETLRDLLAQPVPPARE